MKARNMIAVFAFLFALSCTDEPGPKEHILALASLHPVESCDEVVKLLERGAIEDMEKEIRSNYKRVMDGDDCWEDPGYDENTPVMDACASDSSTSTTPPPEDGEEEPSQHSDTNNQVEGVDEADFIKNDGGHIYILADGQLKIIDSWPAAQSAVIGSATIEGAPLKLFVYGGRALVYSSLLRTGDADRPYYTGECTYGYDCDFTGDGQPLKITVLDISDLTRPVVVRETTFSGSYINSRRVGGAVHTVVSFPGVSFPSLETMPEGYDGYCPSGSLTERMVVAAAFEKLMEENREIIRRTAVTDWLPGVRDTVYVDGAPVTSEGLLEGCDDFYRSGIADGTAFLTIASLEIEKQGPLALATIVGRPGAVYASADALYVASRHSSGNGGWYYMDPAVDEEVTTVHKFLLRNDVPDTLYAASGVVKGSVLNQFSMDEFDGYLRIATTTGHVPDPNVHSTVSVLAQGGTDLVVVGLLDAIAPTEDIRSVRFDGRRGFVVTFKKTDPLFVLDLGDPTNPKIEGELKIPGFSTYMQMMDETHIMSIGYDADDMGDFAWFQGIQLQIMDISKLDEPVLEHKTVIGTRGSTSEAATNHLAFNYFAPLDLLAIPMTICEGGDGGMYGSTMTFSGLLVYSATTDGGFVELGRVSHIDPAVYADDPYGSPCSNWWTESASAVQRSIFMDEFVFSVATDQIKVDSLDNLGVDVAVVDLVD
jgi:uncharacterized secreted protein with C-terminal beta-propeller domain